MLKEVIDLTKTCEGCGNSFTVKSPFYLKTRKYCNNACVTSSQNKRVSLTCLFCKSIFECQGKEKDSRLFCKMKCRREHDKTKHKTCLVCAKKYYVEPRDRESTKTCSRKCRSVYDKLNNSFSGENNPAYKRVWRMCKSCQKPFKVKPCFTNKYCSPSCRSSKTKEINADKRIIKLNKSLSKSGLVAGVTKKNLTDLYLVQKLSTRQIGKIFNTNKTLILKLLKNFNIELRAKGTGAANRGFTLPTKKELFKMIHEEYLTYPEIAKKYGVNNTSIPIWMKKYKISPPKLGTSRTKGAGLKITREVLQTMYVNQNLPPKVIGAFFGVSDALILNRLKEFGFDVRPNMYSSPIVTENGYTVRSGYEFLISDWLIKNNIPHGYEPKLPFGNKMLSDFLVNDTYIEIWGMVGKDFYDERKILKKKLYKENNLKLLEIFPSDFDKRANGRWQRKLAAIL